MYTFFGILEHPVIIGVGAKEDFNAFKD